MVFGIVLGGIISIDDVSFERGNHMTKGDEFVNKMVTDIIDRYMESFERVKSNNPKVDEAILTRLLGDVLYRQRPYDIYALCHTTKLTADLGGSDLTTMVDHVKKMKGVEVLDEKYDYHTDPSGEFIPKEGTLAAYIPYKVGKEEKEGYFVFVFIRDYGGKLTVDAIFPEDARSFVEKKVFTKRTITLGKVPMISTMRKYQRMDVFKHILAIIDPERIVSIDAGSWVSHDEDNIMPVILDDNSVLPGEGEILAHLDYVNDDGKEKTGNFRLKVEGSYDSQTLKLVGPHDSKDYFKMFLADLEDKIKDMVKIHGELPEKIDLESLKSRLSGYEIKFNTENDDVEFTLDKGKLILREGIVEVVNSEGRTMFMRMDSGWGEGVIIEISGDEDLIDDMKKMLEDLGGGGDSKITSFSGEPIQIEGYTREDIAGMESVFEDIEDIMLYLENPEALDGLGISQEKGILLEGPPGTGKTLFAKVIASETQSNFIYIRGSDLTSKWYGEEQKNIHRLFEKARMKAPCLIFIDEIDSITPTRGKTDEYTVRGINQFLAELDGMEELKGVVIICATNRKEAVDPALLRGGRIGRVVEVGLPSKETRKKIFKIHTTRMKLAKGVSFPRLAELSEEMSGADIKEICNMAGINALKLFLKKEGKSIKDLTKTDAKKIKVTMEDMLGAVDKVRAQKECEETVGNGDEGFYA